MMKHQTKLLALLLCLATILPFFTATAGVFTWATETEEDPIVYATEETDPNDADNLCYHKPTRTNTGGTTEKAVDGDPSTYWSGADFPRYIDVDLMANYDLTGITVYLPTKPGVSFEYVLYCSTDGVNFTRIAASELKKPDKNGEKFEFDSPILARVIRVNVTGSSAGANGSSMVAEIKAYGKKSETAVTPTREKLDFSDYGEWLRQKEGVDLAAISDPDGRYDISASYTEADTTEAVRGIIRRLLGEQYVDWFVFEYGENPNGSGNDYFRLTDGADGKLHITGNCGVSLATGLNHYLKYYCFVEISQQTAHVVMPKTAPKVGSEIFRETVFPVRYAYNYCTLSYTMAFFGYDDWQRELDYLMLQGVNLILDTTATEALWIAYLQHYGYSAADALNFVCGYAYKAWWLMGNLSGYGGNVSDTWVYDTLEMARVNQRFMTVMGAKPCLQAFVGTLPNNFDEMAVATLTELGYADPADYTTGTGTWSGFVRPLVMNTTYDGYAYMAQDFYTVQEMLYGQITDYYAGDFFHEINGNPPKEFDKANMSADTLTAMMAADPDGVWILQSWWENPLKEVLDGFGEYREDHILILDLAADQSPRWSDTTRWGGVEFGGTSWIYCTLDNYGGRPGVHGNLDRTAKAIAKAKSKATHMKGIGITPEGTQQNPAVFELFWECAWSDTQIDVDEWVKQYAIRRYGAENTNAIHAWELLIGANNIYSTNTIDGAAVNYPIHSNPSLQAAANVGGYFESGYRDAKFEQALACLMQDFESLKDNECYIDDLVDMLRTEVADQTIDYVAKLKDSASNKDYATFHAYASHLLDAMALINELAGYQKDELFGTWIGRADAWCNDTRTGEYDDYAKDMMEINAKALVTMWASRPITNYAYRQYEGLMTDYYIAMWQELLNNVERQLEGGKKPSDASLALDGGRCFGIAWSVVTNDKSYRTEVADPAGNDTDRGLKAIWEEISTRFLSSKKVTVIPANLRLKEGAPYSASKKLVEGIVSGTTAAELIEQCEDSLGRKAVVRDGKELEATDVLAEGDILKLLSENGKQLDKFTVGKLLYSEAQLAEKKGELENFLLRIEGKTATEETAAALAETEARIREGLAQGITGENADELIALADETLANTVWVEENNNFLQNNWWIILVAGGVILIGVVVALVTRAKKKKAE